MPSVSEKQQQAMGIAHAIQQGEIKGKPGTPSAQIAANMAPADVTEFASTPHKGLPSRKKKKHRVKNVGNTPVTKSRI